MATETGTSYAPPRTDGPGERTIPALWQRAASAGRTNPAYLVEHGDHWDEISWDEAATAVEELANGLLSLGLKKGDAFGIVGRTTPEWCVFDFALGSIGVIPAPVYPSSSAKDTHYVLDHSDAVGVLVEDDEQLAKVREGGEIARLEHVYRFADLDDLRAKGREFAAANPGALAAASAAIAEEDLFTYIYTSGTTGAPKACMILNRNYYDMVAKVDEVPAFIGPDDVLLLYLPLAHNFGRCLHLLAAYVGFTIAFCPDPLRVGEVAASVRPTVLPSVPRVYEKVHTAVLASFDEATGVKRKLIDWALDVGKRVSKLRQEGRPVPRGLAARHRVADRLVYSKVKGKLGGRLRFGISGGAPLAKEIAEFFHVLDIPILEGYGTTECTTASNVNMLGRFRFGTVGPAIPGIELRFADDGELLVRSSTVFAGYYKDPEATRAVLGEDGWLHTGDIASIDEDGFVTITDRKKDILVTAGGKNVAPQNIENDLKASKYVSQAVVLGDKKPYVAALITLDEPEVRKALGSNEARLEELAADDGVRQLVQAVVDDVNRDRSRFEQIKRFAILPRDFSAEEEEITPTLKLRRRVVQEHFADEIEALYA
ncbi:MAG TPA: long-chain fatty acid--CoA ligase [Gaiellaceae bacterium]|nr:long-chain fatty acid--CoA ligase [Gaiellaceae bacterium]